jgi:hypothetical protein
MTRQHRHFFIAENKVRLLQRHVIDKIHVSDLWEQHTPFQSWAFGRR